MVFQNPYASLNPRKKVGTQLEEPLLLNTDLTAQQREQRVREMMTRVACGPSIITAIRTCSPAGSANASRWRAR